MKYKLNDLIDKDKVQNLMDEFYNLLGIPHAIVDNEGNIFSAAGWQDICTKFHRTNPVSEYRCKQSEISAKNMLDKSKEQNIYKCPNGLIQAFTPIIVEEEHIANLFIGQFFFEEPDMEYFKRQAVKFGYDVETYLEAVSHVPIFSKDKIKACMQYYLRLADILSDMGLNQLKQKKSEELLKKHNENLEDLVKERTSKLLKLNKKLEKDILKRKFIENKLKESEERYRTLFETMPYGVCVYSKRKIVFGNTAAAKYYGFDTFKEILGKRLFDIISPHPDYEEDFNENVKLIEEEGNMPLREEQYIRKNDNKILNVETVTTSIPYDGEKTVLAVFRDISERKNLERLNKKVEEKTILLEETLEGDRLKTEFFANISHELKTPINVIFSALQMTNSILKDIPLIENKYNMSKYLNIMSQNCFRLIRLVNNLLDITKIDSGYYKVQLTNYNIINVVEDIVLSVVEYAKNAGIELVFDTEMEEKILACDRDKIERIILNLLSNAIKFTEPGGKIFVNIMNNQHSIIISVKDTGIGIPKEKQKLIFERFVQVDKSLSREQEGSGIGLSLVKSLVEMHEGQIYVNSEYKEGSEFIIKLPVNLVEEVVKKEDRNLNRDGQANINKVNIEFSDIYL
ncbi:MASE3 domain-containing sensor histidine kinase [Clostridium ganghwense]|uniref:histidine kinase n=1 Tax=Clostridium ganghwense TaxID=312089 RepID=A0ABT4CM06_9CLOT|nr:PocR ligand-binding domain-containing protein [Clostridium ganghwense]MCY6370085.1 PocR ligand-binding domain-containing protein [Clostridium ganghwense]